MSAAIRLYLNLSIFFTVFVNHNTIIAQELTGPELSAFSLEGLMQVSIASKTPRKVKDIPATVYIYTAEDIKQHGWLYLSEILRDVPGVDMADAGSGTFFTTRGVADASAHGNKTVIMINGHNISLPSTNSANFLGLQKDINLASIKRVEVLVGPGSTLHGANAFGMVVDLITYDPEDIDGIVGRVSYGSNREAVTSLTASFGKNRWSGLLSGTYINQQKTNLAEIQISSTTGMETYDNSRFEDNFQKNYAIDGYLDYDRQVRLGFNLMHNDSGHGTLFLSTEVGRRVFDKQLIFLDINRKVSNQFEYKLRSHYLKTDTIAEKNKREFTGSVNTRGSSDVGAESITLDNQFIYALEEKHTLLTGLFIARSRQRPVSGSFTDTGKTIPPPKPKPAQNWDNYALYLQWEWKPINKIYSVIGMRYVNSVKQYDSAYLPHIGLNYNLQPTTTLKLNYQRGYRPPSAFEVGSSAPFLRPNPILKSEFINNYEVSLVQSMLDKLNARMTLFYTDVSNIIKRNNTGDVVSGTTNPIFIDENSAEMHVKGLEIGLKGKLFDNLDMLAVASYTDSHDSSTDYDTETVVPYKLNVSLEWQMRSDIMLVVDNYWRVHPTTSPDNTVFIGKDAPSWLLMNANLRVGKFFTLKNLSANLTLRNVLNEKYGMIDRRGGAANVPGVHPAELRNIMFSLEYHY